MYVWLTQSKNIMGKQDEYKLLYLICPVFKVHGELKKTQLMFTVWRKLTYKKESRCTELNLHLQLQWHINKKALQISRFNKQLKPVPLLNSHA